MKPQKKGKTKKPDPVRQQLQVDTRRWLKLWLALLISAVAIIQYIQTISYEFALDDYSAIIENGVTRDGINAIPTIFKTTYRYGYPIQGDELYRPITKSVFAIFWEFFPENPLPLHLLNILLYAFTGFLLFNTLTRFITGNIYVPFIASLIFIAHPIHSEVVSNIKSADEILSFLFFVISLHYLQKFMASNKNKWMWLAALSYFASLLSKESAITFLAIYPLMIFFFKGTSLVQGLRRSWVMIIPALLFLLIRYRIVGDASEPTMADNVLMATENVLERKATAIYILGKYLWLLVIPHPLSFDYSYRQVEIVRLSDWRVWISFLIYCSMLVYALLRFKKRDVIVFGILFYLITLSISSNLFITIGTHMAERLLYVPSFGFCLALSAIADRLIQNKNYRIPESLKAFFSQRLALTGMVLLIVIVFTVKAWSQNATWKNNLTLYEHGVIFSPESHRTHYYLGQFITKKDHYSKYPEAEQKEIISRGLSELRKSVSLYPDYSDAILHIGNYYSAIQQNDSALFYFSKAIEMDPYLATAHNNLGTVYFEMQQLQKAIDEFLFAIRCDPNYHDAYRNLGSAYGTIGKFREAIPYFRKALELAPSDAQTIYFLGITYQSLGDAINAKIYLDKAASLDQQFRK